MDDVENRIKALKLWLAEAPIASMHSRGLHLAGEDADAVFRYIEEERMTYLRRIAEMEASRKLIRSKGTIVMFPARGNQEKR